MARLDSYNNETFRPISIVLLTYRIFSAHQIVLLVPKSSAELKQIKDFLASGVPSSYLDKIENKLSNKISNHLV